MRKISIKWKLFSFLAVFVALILLLLWVMQVVLLEDFYEYIKINEIKKAAYEIKSNIDSEDILNTVMSMANDNDISVIIASRSGQIIYEAEGKKGSLIFRVDPSQFYIWMEKAEENGGEYIQMFTGFSDKNTFYGDRGEAPRSIVYSLAAKTQDGSDVLILLNSSITPVDSTVRTIRTQLVLITAAMLLGALGLAFLISYFISKPITKITETSKKLAAGDYKVHFNGTGYREIEDLSESLNYAASELSKVDDYRRELLANVSHDLRTPLTLITGYAEAMRDLPGENTPENIQTIIDEAERLTTLVNDVLDMSKFESNVQSLDISRFNITESIREITSRLAKMTSLDGYEIELSSDRNVFIKADKIKISQALYNLIGNAITHTDDNKKVVIKQDIKDEKTVRISVIDYGRGIPENKLREIWDRYYKADKEHKRAQVGTGLGLSIVKSIFVLHKIRYGVMSEEGKGSIFWFEFPIDG